MNLPARTLALCRGSVNLSSLFIFQTVRLTMTCTLSKLHQRQKEFKLKILIVEDDRDTCDVLKQFLEFYGIMAVCALCAEDAMRLYLENNFDMLLVDISLPGMNGIDFMHWVRQRENGARTTPIVALTNHSAGPIYEIICNAGFDQVARKPTDLDRLPEIVKSMISNSLYVAGCIAGASSRGPPPAAH